ncbi:hypothetical protein [Flavihumibacter sp. UBA7668]|uniref:hypothetical protein n=1 Tax=Flavihumibacter sp. UBA7668 TaxID=1946542 RepID=UPI0025C47B87|nr:hypothetical protein [Flavihumibacter sp. UBA7668]
MNLYPIQKNKYSAIFFQSLAVKAIFVLASYLLLNNGLVFINTVPVSRFTLHILIGMVALAWIHTGYQKKQLSKIKSIEDFDVRINEYEKFYKFRLIWFLFSCFISCSIALFTARHLFIGYAIVDILISLPFYPNLPLFKRELNNSEILLC